MKTLTRRLSDVENVFKIHPSLCEACRRPVGQRPILCLPHNHRDPLPDCNACDVCNSYPLVMIVDVQPLTKQEAN
jgi:hypothetical protein